MLHPLLSLCWAQEAAECEVTKNLGPSCETAATVSCRGPQAQDKEQAEAQAHEGRQRAVPVPKEQQNRGEILKTGPSVYLSLLLPQECISQATASPAPRTTILGHIHCCHGGLLMSWWNSFQTLYSFTAHTLLCQLLLYFQRVTTASSEKYRRCHAAVFS